MTDQRRPDEHPNGLRVGWTTTATPTEAQTLAPLLLGAGAACVQIDPAIESHYTWNGVLHRDRETRLWVKYAAIHENALQEVLRQHHPYECPQWITMTVTTALPAYANWILNSLPKP
ncbi:MAG: hypothetical protein RL648_249 [Verrucomicrobiota bacterium]